MRQSDHRLDAYMTVEAAVIIPMATFMIALIIYLAFFKYGKCILSQDAYLLGLRASLFYESQGYGSASEYISDKKDEQISGKYFGSKVDSINADESGKTIYVEGELTTTRGSMGGFFNSIPTAFNAQIHENIKKHDSPGSLRTLKRIEDLAKNIVEKKKKKKDK